MLQEGGYGGHGGATDADEVMVAGREMGVGVFSHGVLLPRCGFSALILNLQDMNLDVLTTSEPGEHERVLQGLDEKGDSHVYLIHDAVVVWQSAGWERIAGEHCRVYVCAYNLEKREIDFPEAGSPVLPCGLSLLGRLLTVESSELPVDIVHGTDREAKEEAGRVARGLQQFTELTIQLSPGGRHDVLHHPGRVIRFD
jgi:hypothetical protein